MNRSDMSWTTYLSDFHRTRPGVTEQVLTRSRCRGPEGTANPYTWLLAAIPRRGRILDVACGNAPLQPDLSSCPRAGPYVGVDVSRTELVAARRAGRGPLVQADAAAIPLADSDVEVVVCSMGLMVLSPLPAVLAEIRRVLAPGGLLVASVPATGPLRRLDVPVVGGLVAALGRRLNYPNDAALRRMPSRLAQAGLRMEADERRRFGYRLHDTADADAFLSSLYLPGVPDHAYGRARAYLRMLARSRVELPVPIRRVIACAEPAAGIARPGVRAPRDADAPNPSSGVASWHSNDPTVNPQGQGWRVGRVCFEPDRGYQLREDRGGDLQSTAALLRPYG